MNILLISKYINKLTKDDIKTFAYNKGIPIEEYEIDSYALQTLNPHSAPINFFIPSIRQPT